MYHLYKYNINQTHNTLDWIYKSAVLLKKLTLNYKNVSYIVVILHYNLEKSSKAKRSQLNIID